MAHTIYDNFFLSNEIEDLYNSKLDLQQFCTVDNNLTEVAGMRRIINRYTATGGAEKLGIGEGNTESIEVSFTPYTYDVLTVQSRFPYYDEQAMTDPMLITTATEALAVGMFNTVNADIYAAFNEATLEVTASEYDFAAFANALAALEFEQSEETGLFGFVSPADMAAVRIALKDDLKYVEAFSRTGYVGTVAGINLYTKKDAVDGTCIIGTKQAVTLFNKKGTEVEQAARNSDDANVRLNTIYSRKYYIAALTDATKAVKITVA